jgi:hypothetical protein
MTKRHREKTLAYWKKRAEALAPAEKELHSKMEPQVEDVLKGKRILLLKEMLMSIAYSDVKVVEELVAGFPLVGELILSSLFPEQRKEATASRGSGLECPSLRRRSSRSSSVQRDPR